METEPELAQQYYEEEEYDQQEEGEDALQYVEDEMEINAQGEGQYAGQQEALNFYGQPQM